VTSGSPSAPIVSDVYQPTVPGLSTVVEVAAEQATSTQWASFRSRFDPLLS
jgi:hypothetical protein